MINALKKGATFERLVRLTLNEQLYIHGFPYVLERNLNQTRDGGCDLVGLPGFSFECKRYKNGSTYRSSWWNQTCDNAADDEIPVLIYKYDRQEIQAVVPIDWFFSAQFIGETPKQELRDHTAVLKFDSFVWFLMCYLGVTHGK